MVVNLFHALLGLVGVLMLYGGIFLTETEEGQLRNSLEELWVRVDDLHAAAMSRQAAFLQQVSALTERGMVTLFGQKLFSLKSLASCLCFAIASIFLSLALLVGDSPAFPRTATLIWSGFFLLFALSRRLRYLGLVLTSLGAILGLLSLGGVFGAYQLSFKDVVSGSAGYLLGALSVIGSIALTRWSLRVASRVHNVAFLAAIIGGNVLLAATLLSPLLIAFLVPSFFVRGPGRTLPSGPLKFLFSTSGTTLFAAALAVVVVLVLLAALVHRVLWPVMSRTIYAVHRHGLVQPKLLRAVGCACLLLAWPNNILVKAISKTLHLGS